MMPIGSEVIYCGKYWNNQVRGVQPVFGIKKSPAEDESVNQPQKFNGKTFAELLAEKINEVNDDQLSVTKVAEKVITAPDEVNVHDVAIAIAKAKQSLDLSQNIIDRVTTSWKEILATGTR